MTMRIVAPNKHEIWPSIALLVFGIFAFRSTLPERPTDTIGFAVVLLFSWVLALNAALDWKRAATPMRPIIILWMMFVTYGALQVLPADFTFDMRWANR